MNIPKAVFQERDSHGAVKTVNIRLYSTQTFNDVNLLACTNISYLGVSIRLTNKEETEYS